MSDFQLTDSQQVVVEISAVDEDDNPTTLDAGSVAATIVGSTTATATVDPSQSFVTLVAGNDVQDGAVLTVTGTVNGSQATPGTLTFDVSASTPSTIVLTPGTPTAVTTPSAPVASTVNPDTMDRSAGV